MTPEDTMGVWYEKGVRFSCTRCGACCLDHGEATAVILNEGEPERLARLLELPAGRFFSKYTRGEGGFLCLANRGRACVFFSVKTGCTVRSARPLQCATWPFWPENLEPARWEKDVLAVCPGIGKGRLHSADRIERIARSVKYARQLEAGGREGVP